MLQLNQHLFLILNAPASPALPLLVLAICLAEYLIWSLPLLLLYGWFSGRPVLRRAAFDAGLAALCALTVNQFIGLAWPNPRPFVIGLGHTLIAHAADPSFPSDHLTLFWSVGIALWLTPATRRVGGGLLLLGLPMAWARIYLGVHYPLDMLGAAVVAGAMGVLVCRTARPVVGRVFDRCAALPGRL
jgi:undecaprenyl-diphosphatase